MIKQGILKHFVLPITMILILLQSLLSPRNKTLPQSLKNSKHTPLKVSLPQTAPSMTNDTILINKTILRPYQLLFVRTFPTWMIILKINQTRFICLTRPTKKSWSPIRKTPMKLFLMNDSVITEQPPGHLKKIQLIDGENPLQMTFHTNTRTSRKSKILTSNKTQTTWIKITTSHLIHNTVSQLPS
jgi:hypothetical protein